MDDATARQHYACQIQTDRSERAKELRRRMRQISRNSFCQASSSLAVFTSGGDAQGIVVLDFSKIVGPTVPDRQFIIL